MTWSFCKKTIEIDLPISLQHMVEVANFKRDFVPGVFPDGDAVDSQGCCCECRARIKFITLLLVVILHY